MIIQRVGHEERNDLFRILIRTDVVGATGDRHRQAIGDVIGVDQVIAAGLAGRVGAAWGHAVGFQAAMVAVDMAVDLIGADLMIAQVAEVCAPPPAGHRCRRHRSG